MGRPPNRAGPGALARQGFLRSIPSGFDSRPAYYQVSSYLNPFQPTTSQFLPGTRRRKIDKWDWP